jgi:hypothetical protein
MMVSPCPYTSVTALSVCITCTGLSPSSSIALRLLTIFIAPPPLSRRACMTTPSCPATAPAAPRFSAALAAASAGVAASCAASVGVMMSYVAEVQSGCAWAAAAAVADPGALLLTPLPPDPAHEQAGTRDKDTMSVSIHHTFPARLCLRL